MGAGTPRELEVIGVVGSSTDTMHVLCADPESGEEFSVEADEKLRAALRGDLTRLGQLEIEMESQLRPREIQARIRAGASVAEVAKAAGTSAARIEPFAHPVLMERAAMAEKAAGCMVEGAATKTAVRDVVDARLVELGQTTKGDAVTWDAHRDRDGWVLTARWTVGRNRNLAEFGWHPVAGGGAVIPRDEMAHELVRPERSPLRGVPTRAFEPTVEVPGLTDETRPLPRLSTTGEIISRTSQPLPAARGASDPAARETRQPVPTVQPEPEPAEPDPIAEQLVAATVEDSRAGVTQRRERRERALRTGTDAAATPPAPHPAAAGKSKKPAMPSWDDVLLGGTKHR